MKYLLFLFFILSTQLPAFSQGVDTFTVFATDTQYSRIVTIKDRHGGTPYWWQRMNANAPDGYYFIYKKYSSDSTKMYLLREGLFLNGHTQGEWIEYWTNGKKYCIEKWNEKGNTGYKKFFTKRGVLQRYMRWEEGKIVENECYRDCK